MKDQFKKILPGAFQVTPAKRRVFFLCADTLLIFFSLYGSFWLRFDGAIPQQFQSHIFYYFGLTIFVKISFLFLFGMYNISWRFFGLKEFTGLLSALTLSSMSIAILLFFFKTLLPYQGYPRSVLLLDYIFSLGLIGILRISKRVVKEYINKTGKLKRGRIKTLIVGAGDAGEQIVKEMLNNSRSKYFPMGFIDDDPAKQKLSIYGVKVLGSREEIPEIIEKADIDEVLVAIPSSSSQEIRLLVEHIRNADETKKVKIKILPRILDLMDGNVSLSDIKEVRVDDLLGREPVKIDYSAIRGFLQGKCTLITGAGGSIGGELSRTVLQFEPKKVILLDIDETELYYLMNRIKMSPIETIPVVADIRDRAKMESIFKEYKPQVVLHAAAYKHVPILERFPEEAVKTNVIGTRVLGELAVKYGTSKFVNISTDKAINPTSIMGTSKRIGEEILRSLNQPQGARFISVRFGNVLGSRGSVIPLFEAQIQKGGPVTVTHPNMKRYFMATSEAVLLVLEAAASGEGGEVYILDMGEPVKIDDLAREMIRLSGHEPDVDIAIVYTGLRPGEKLFEELLGVNEGSESTEHQKIFKALSKLDRTESSFWEQVDRLEAISASSGHREGIVEIMKELVPTYKPDMRSHFVLNW